MTHTLASIRVTTAPNGATIHTGTCTCGAGATLRGATSASDWHDQHSKEADG